MKSSKYELQFLRQLSMHWLPEPVPEYHFALAIGRAWRFDFAWPDLKVAFEAEGGSWVDGRHTRGSGFEGDCEKYSWAALLGWLVIRGNDHQIASGKSIQLVEYALALRQGKGEIWKSVTAKSSRKISKMP